ncbi:AAEL002649-PA [Aedes aegypti]|uniref:AAEL002649-PA n=1 Tax=Aedes aegypti TaxID=7159 RepID=Q17HM2_AEDAE|nr:AAEL002649-PA [Aedes aegypti]
MKLSLQNSNAHKKDNFDGPNDPALHGQRFADVISNIQKYFQELPRFEDIMNTLVTQPIIGDAVSSQLTFIIKVSGTVIYQDNSTKPFQKTFTVTAQGDKWKIAIDCSAASGCWMLSF